MHYAYVKNKDVDSLMLLGELVLTDDSLTTVFRSFCHCLVNIFSTDKVGQSKIIDQNLFFKLNIFFYHNKLKFLKIRLESSHILITLNKIAA